VGVVQDHADERRVRMQVAALERADVGGHPLDLRDIAFLLQALQMRERVARTVDRIDHAARPYPLGETQAHIAGSGADIEHAMACLQNERFDPGRHQVGALHLPRVHLVPGGMAQVFSKRLLHDGPGHKPKWMSDQAARPRVAAIDTAPVTRIDVGRRLSLICQATTVTITSDMPSMASRTKGAAVMELMAASPS